MTPIESRQFTAAIATFFTNFFGAMVIKFGPNLEDAIGTASMFYVFAGMTLAGGVTIAILLPETKGKNAEELRLLFVKKEEGNKNNNTA